MTFKIKHFVSIVIIAALIILATFLNASIGYGASSGFSINADVYEFDKKSSYDISSSSPVVSTSAYGEFSISGNISNIASANGIPAYTVKEGNLNLAYTYGNDLLNADESDWKLVEDKSKEVDGFKLDDNILNGAVLLFTSKDGEKWVNVTNITNIFEDTPVQTEPFYTTTNVQLDNGCYYRIIVVYETRILTKEGSIPIVGGNQYDYKKTAEVYEFYAVTEGAEQTNSNTNRKLLGTKVNTGNKDNGYSENNEVDVKDVHYGWDLGSFVVTGYTQETVDSDGTPVFLKNVGDTVTLSFHLDQDIGKLNGNDKLTISEDKDGSDQQFQIAKQNFGKGTLIINYIDDEGNKKPVTYTNFLEANATPNADTKVELFEEGNYEAALDYEIKEDGIAMFNNYSHYRIYIKFYVRNGNCMAYLFDSATGSELNNTSIADNGFSIDLAKSKYLTVYVKRDVLKQGANGLSLDTRSNKPASDGDTFTDEGIYTITVSNIYTNQKTEKTIYVGYDSVSKAYVTNGLSLEELQEQLNQGAEINDDGTLIKIAVKTNENSNTPASGQTQASSEKSTDNENESAFPMIPVIAVSVVVVIAAIVMVTRKSKKAKDVISADSHDEEKTEASENETKDE